MSSYKIDWRSEMRRMSPYLAGKGGVVRVRYHGPGSGWNRFNAVLKELHAAPPHPSFSVRIDPDWFSTRTLDDVLFEFEKKLGLTERLRARANRDPLTIASNLQVGGNTSITVSNVTVEARSTDTMMNRQDRVEAVADALGSFVRAGRCMVVVQHHPSGGLNFFWRHFWSAGIAELVSDGLLLVHFHDLEGGDAIHIDAPDADLTITLPRDLTDDSRSAEAYDDLYDVFTSKGMSGDQAAEAAQTLLILSEQTVAAVHDNLAKRLLKLAERTGERPS